MAAGQVVFLVFSVSQRNSAHVVAPPSAPMALAEAKDVSCGNTQIWETIPHSYEHIPMHYVPTWCSHPPAELSHSRYIVLDREANLAKHSLQIALDSAQCKC